MTASAQERAESAQWIAGRVKQAARNQRTLYGAATIIVDELDDLAAAPLTPADGHLLMAVALFIEQLAPELAKIDSAQTRRGVADAARFLMMIGEVAYSRAANDPRRAKDGAA